MPIVNQEQYQNMLAYAYKNHFAYPAINVSNLETANATIMAFADAKSDGIIQVSIGGGKHASGQGIGDSVLGAETIAEHIHRVASHYNVNIALHTDHCQPAFVDSFFKPLVVLSEKRLAEKGATLFQSHMFDGSELGLKENLAISKELLYLCHKNQILLEVEIGIVGGEEDGVDNSGTPKEKLYTSPEDMIETYQTLSENGKYSFMLAATFGNVHGVYKPGNVKLTPSILKNGQDAIKKEFGDHAHFWLVFHGGSGSSKEDIKETLNYGVIKMNVDTDTQYAFTRPIVDHILTSYEGVLKIEGEVGNKKLYDPRSFLKKGEQSMKARIIEACKDLGSINQSLQK